VSIVRRKWRSRVIATLILLAVASYFWTSSQDTPLQVQQQETSRPVDADTDIEIISERPGPELSEELSQPGVDTTSTTGAELQPPVAPPNEQNKVDSFGIDPPPEENLGLEFIRAFGGLNTRFESTIDRLIAEEGIDEEWSAQSVPIVQGKVSGHFDMSTDAEAASECLETVCYVDLNLALPADQVIAKWKGFQAEWTGDPTLSRTTVLYKKDDQFYRLYFFRRGFQVTGG